MERGWGVCGRSAVSATSEGTTFWETLVKDIVEMVL